MIEPLYRTEAEIARAVLGPGHLDEWRALVIILQRNGMPYAVEPLTQKYYWPKVKAWLDVWNRVDRIAAAPTRRSGRETWPTKSKRPDSTRGSERTVNVVSIGPPPRNT